tara:strand:+ start:319 stop:609 length:291 start_codon:yes stop_codon:yes gene_type:complete
MTEKQMENLAEIIFQKLLTRQAEFDKQFLKQVKEHQADFDIEIINEPLDLNEKQSLEAEVSLLSKLLLKLEENEEYNKAAEVHDKLNKLIDKLEKL